MRVFLPLIVLTIAAITLSTFGGERAIGQNVYQDYRVNATGSYSPQDPWKKGHVYRTHTGHDGLFYNCDGEEEKRCSPWIRWGHRPCDDLLSVSRIRGEYHQSVCDAVERLRLGSCQNRCGVIPGMGYPPGAGYGNELALSENGAPTLDTAPDTMTAPQNDELPIPPPEPQPATKSSPRIRQNSEIPIVNLPSINHLRPVPR